MEYRRELRHRLRATSDAVHKPIADGSPLTLNRVGLRLLAQEEGLSGRAVAGVLLQLHAVGGRGGGRIQTEPTVAGYELIRSVAQRDRPPLLVGPSSVAPELNLRAACGRAHSPGHIPYQGCVAVCDPVVAAVCRR